MSILVEIKLKRRKNQLLKLSIERRLGLRLQQKRLQEIKGKIQKKLVYKAKSYLMIFTKAIAYYIIYDI